jgi:hypothetical protein
VQLVETSFHIAKLIHPPRSQLRLEVGISPNAGLREKREFVAPTIPLRREAGPRTAGLIFCVTATSSNLAPKFSPLAFLAAQPPFAITLVGIGAAPFWPAVPLDWRCVLIAARCGLAGYTIVFVKRHFVCATHHCRRARSFLPLHY